MWPQILQIRAMLYAYSSKSLTCVAISSKNNLSGSNSPTRRLYCPFFLSVHGIIYGSHWCIPLDIKLVFLVQ
jgi:hypothetical protein